MESSLRTSSDDRRFLKSTHAIKLKEKKIFLFLHDNYTFNVLFMMDMKYIISSLDKFHSRSDSDDATLNK